MDDAVSERWCFEERFHSPRYLYQWHDWCQGGRHNLQREHKYDYQSGQWLTCNNMPCMLKKVLHATLIA